MSEKRPLEPKDIYKIRTVGGAELSSDGKYIAYIAQRIDEDKDKSFVDIYLAETETGKTRRLTSTGKDGAPKFSPDGKRLAFTSGRTDKGQIWILDLDGGEAWKLATEQSVSSFDWAPDSKSIFYTARVFSKTEDWVPYPGAPEYDRERIEKITNKPHADKKDDGKKQNNVRVITDFRYRADGAGYLGEAKSHVFVTPVPEEAPLEELKPQGKQITSGDWNHSAPAISPDSKFIIVSSRHSETAALDGKQDLWLYEVESGDRHLIYDAPGPAGNPGWSPCGNYLTFMGHDRRCGQSTSTHLYLLDVKKVLQGDFTTQTHENAIPVTLPLDRAVGAYAGPELRLWGGHSSFWKDGEFYFIMTDKGVPGVYKTDTKGNVTPVLVDQNRAITSVHGAGNAMIYNASAPNQLDELYVSIDGKERPVTNVNDKFLEDVVMGDWEYMPYKSDDGQDVDGWVIYPTDYKPEEKYPLLLLIHGGPHGAYGPAFMFTGQQFAGQGYIVLYTNPRGSESYGQEFCCCIDKNWGDRDYADIMAGVDALIAKGNVDEDNMFVHGWSYGGYMSCWMITQTDRFKAICAGASVTNMLSGYGTSDITLADEWEYGGQPWKDAMHLMEHSPLHHVEKVKTPLMLMHGENDLRCHPGQAEEFYVALKRLGKEAIMVRYPNEFHGLRRPIHRVDRYQRLLSWFNHYRG